MSPKKDPVLSVRELLEQDKIWVHREGQELRTVRLDDMDLQHLKSLRSWLLRQADSIHYGAVHQVYQTLAFVNGEQAELDLENEMARMDRDPVEWMRDQPLFIALTDRLERVRVDKFTKTDLAILLHLAKLALAAPPGTHTDLQMGRIAAVCRKLEGTGKDLK